MLSRILAALLIGLVARQCTAKPRLRRPSLPAQLWHGPETVP